MRATSGKLLSRAQFAVNSFVLLDIFQFSRIDVQLPVLA